MSAAVAAAFTGVACKADDAATPVAGAESARVTSTAGVVSTATVARPTLAPPRKPERLDVDALKRAFKCGAEPPAGPCEVLKEFDACVPWSPVTQSGDGRFMGDGYVVKGGAFVEEVTLLRTRRVPSEEASPGDLPARIALAAIPQDRSAEREHAKKAIGAYARGDVPKPNNAAVRYVKERAEWVDATALAAEHDEIYVANRGGAHICALKNQRIVVIQRASERLHEGDGVYAVLFPVSW
ncbi:MAG: hypothetical protein EXR75_04445 [Myxococcales bacterium]|nr:hypothetical protein [Myxococcales bacterium]